MAEIPTTEPLKATAGTTWQWQISLADYPAPTWTLTYALVKLAASPGSPITLTASASGTSHLVTVPKATTAGYAAATYSWRAFVADATTRHLVRSGLLTVEADFATTTADQRSHARTMLDAIESAIEGRATSTQLMYSIGGMQVQNMTPSQMASWLSFYRAEVRREEERILAANGVAQTRPVQRITFTAPGAR